MPDFDADRRFLEVAIEEALVGLAENGIPIGAVLCRGSMIIGRGHNRRVQCDDPIAHAEIDCLRNAGRQTSYKNTALYSTLMLCYLCAGAVVQFGIPRVVVGESRNFEGAKRFLVDHGVDVVDLGDPRCIDLMAKFIAENPKLWDEDIGHE